MRRWWIPVLVLAALVVTGAATAPKPKTHAGPAVDCAACHTCETPTERNPCLKACPRHESMKKLSADLGPDVVILDDLEDLYVPVRFNHKMHATMAGMNSGCESCHHYTPAGSAHPACKDCHPIEVVHEDLSQPGLKGAYHRQCMGCHTEWDNDTKCEICHEKKAGGRLGGTATEVCEHSHYEPVEMLELITFKTDYAPGDQVPFHHRNHSTMYERDCTECHQEQGCQRCHTQGKELHPMGALAEVNLHDTCFRCHDDQKCDECHGRSANDYFRHSDTGWPLKGYHAQLNCRACHGQRGEFKKLDSRCESCHPSGWSAAFNHAVTGVALDAVHAEIACSDCHTAGVSAKPSCEGCHDAGWKYDPKTGFGGR